MPPIPPNSQVPKGWNNIALMQRQTYLNNRFGPEFRYVYTMGFKVAQILAQVWKPRFFTNGCDLQVGEISMFSVKIWRENILKSVGMFITDNYRKGSRYHIQVSYWMPSTENGARTSRNTTLSLIEQPSKWPALTALEGSIFLSWDIILHGSVREGVKKKSSFFRKKS